MSLKLIFSLKAILSQSLEAWITLVLLVLPKQEYQKQICGLELKRYVGQSLFL